MKNKLIRISNVRNTTKFKRSIRAISPVIATLLMIAIAVVASLVVYAWVTGYMGNTTSKAGKAIQIQSFALADDGLHVYVQNVGQGAVELSTMYVDSNLQTFTPDPNYPDNVLEEGKTTDLLVAGTYVENAKLNIKVTTTDGTFMTATGIPKTTNPITPAVTYAVDFVLGTGGLSMNPTGAQTVGGTIAITATENTGYHFTSWSSTGSITFTDANLAATTATINGAGSITANFAADTVQYSVTFEMSGDSSATISPTVGAYSYDAGTSVPITGTASSGYHFASWSSSTGSITFGDDSLASTSATINGAGTVTANFAVDSVTQYQITVTQTTHGTIAPGTSSYDAGSTPSFTITPESGYHIASVTTNAGAQALTSPYVFPALSADATLTATFEANVVTPVTITLRPNAAGSTEDLDEDYHSLSNWQCVDEDPSDSSTTYVYGGSDNNWRTDTYNLNNPGLSGTITQVQIFANVRRESQSGAPTSQVSARTAIRLGSGSIEYGSTSQDLSTAWTTYSSTYATKQGNLGSGSWTWTDINNLQIGVSLRSQNDYSWWNNHWSWAQCTQVWVVVTYTPA